MSKTGGAKLVKEVGSRGVGLAKQGASFAYDEVSGTIGNFRRTILENKGIAIGFIVGMTLQTFIKSLVDDLFMPLLEPLIGDEGERDWKKKVLNIGPVSLRVGSLLSSFINLFVTIIAVYIMIQVLE
jgi:large-conductance mechanosensitive channel